MYLNDNTQRHTKIIQAGVRFSAFQRRQNLRLENPVIESSSNKTMEMRLFKKFIDEINLTEPSVVGRRFLWVRSDGSTTMIDRFMVLEEWLRMFGELSKAVDHCPMILKEAIRD
ncbi:hypothetical protein VNO77_07504 [Canavalia gladiata]|uniref:Uncharacterized protein n=1 Tax=Canavalia gladiata TaxID=3824 RepID=A0AAN9QW68_CANGL